MKTIIYYTCNHSPIALIMAARKTGLLHNDRSLVVSDLKQLTLFHSRGIKGRLIFMGVDENYNNIYTLIACSPKELILRFLNSFLDLHYNESKYSAIIDCSGKTNMLLLLSWFLYQKNIFRSISGNIICIIVNKEFSSLTAQTENL